MVNLTLRVLSRPDTAKLPVIVQNLGLEYDERATAAAGMGLVELRRIEASREVAGTLEKSPNVTYLPGGNNMMMALNPAG
ncbi:hypothetical protein RYX36_010998 [Vicia faba]